MEEGRLTYRQQAEELRARPRSGLAISNYRSVPEVLNAYILTRCGALFSPEPLNHPEIWQGRQINQEIVDNALLLNHRQYWHPETLRNLIFLADGAGEITRQEKTFLLELQKTASHSHSHHESRWFEARSGLQRQGSAQQLQLHDYLSSLMDVYFNDPSVAFRKGIEALARLENHPLGLAVLNPVTLKVPVLKNESDEEADVVDYAEFEFDRTKAVYLPGTYFRGVTGGASNSGKSTFTASLCETMRHLVRACESDGILEPGQLKVATYDLDSTSPTIHSIASGKNPFRSADERWSIRRAETTAGAFVDLSQTQGINIALGDLPGGGPDVEVTYIIARTSHFSIIVDRNQGEEMKKWRDFFKGLSNHSTLILAHSRLHEEGRNSGIRNFTSSLKRANKSDLLWGRVTNLERSLKTDDPFIAMAAHALLFDFLPGSIIAGSNLRSNLHLSLNS